MASNRVGISSDKTNLRQASNVCRVLLTINAVARNILSVQGTKLYTQKYVLAWEATNWQRMPAKTIKKAAIIYVF